MLENVVKNKSFAFAFDNAKLYQYLVDSKKSMSCLNYRIDNRYYQNNSIKPLISLMVNH